MRIRSDPAELVSVRRVVRESARAVGFDEDEVERIILAVDEALTNVIRHGYGGAFNEPIDIEINQIRRAAESGINVVIRDFGKQVDPDMISPRPLNDVRPGGLGVHIIQTVMDEVSYVPVDDGGMRLVMFKKRTQ